MSLPNSIDVFREFLYGSASQTGNPVGHGLIRDESVSGGITVGSLDYMDPVTGPGRFANAAKFELVSNFFNDKAFLLQAAAAGSFDSYLDSSSGTFVLSKAQLAQVYSLPYYGLVVNQHTVSDSYADYSDRTFVWNTTEFQISDSAQFVIDPTNEMVTIKDFSVEPRRGVVENFDFEGGSWLTNIGNGFLQAALDPSGLGRLVQLQIVEGHDSLPKVTYTEEMYNLDVTKVASWDHRSIFDAQLAMSALVHDLFDAGVAPVLFDDRPVLFGTSGDDFFASGPFSHNGIDISIQASGGLAAPLADYVQNGILYFTGDGDDQVFGSEYDDLVYLGEGNDIYGGGSNLDYDEVYGEGGDDQLLGGLVNDFLNGGVGDDFIFGREGDDWLEGGDGSDTLIGGPDSDIIVFDSNDGLVVGDNYVFHTDLPTFAPGWDVAVFDDGGVFGSLDALDTREFGGDFAHFEALLGGGGDDYLSGFAHYVGGGAGNDTLVSSGFDERDGPTVLWGGSGADRFFIEGYGPGILIVKIPDLDSETFPYLTREAILDSVPNLGLMSTGLIHTIIVNPDSSDRLILEQTNGAPLQVTPLTEPPEGADEDSGWEDFGSFNNGEPNAWIWNSLVFQEIIPIGPRGASWDVQAHLLEMDNVLPAEIDVEIDGPDYIASWFILGGAVSPSGSIVTNSQAPNIHLGTSGDDLQNGSEGDEAFFGGRGSDSIDGGGGFDIVNYAASALAVTIDLSSGLVSGGHADGDHILGIEGASGSNFDDSLSGGFSANFLSGRLGDDVISGGAGGDTLLGGAGDDTITGGADDDLIETGDGHDMLQFFSGDGADTVTDFDLQNDQIWINGVVIDPSLPSGGFTIIQAGNDIVISNPSEPADLIVLENAVLAAWVDATLANRTVSGTSGNDLIDTNYVDPAGNSINDSGQQIETNGGNDTVFDGAGNDTVIGSSDGQDHFFAGAGADHYDGVDSFRAHLYYTTATSGLILNLTDASERTGIAQGDTYANLEWLYGSDFSDTITVGGEDVRKLNAGGGDDVIIVGGYQQVSSGAGSDTFVFNDPAVGGLRIDDFTQGSDLMDVSRLGITSLADFVVAEASNNTFTTLTFNSADGIVQIRLQGGDWIDANGHLTLVLDDFVFADAAASGDGKVSGTAGDDLINGSYFDSDGDTINDLGQVIETGAGNDTVYDGAGNDTVIGSSSGQDYFFAGAGADHYDGVDSFRSNLYYTTAQSGLVIDLTDTTQSTGIAEGDTYANMEGLHGSDYADTITTGSAAIRKLFAGGGDDSVVAGGYQQVWGGGGSDTFVFNDPAAGGLRIEDFTQGADLLDVSGLGVGSMMDLVFADAANSTFITVSYSTSNGTVQIRLQGGDWIDENGTVALTENDFIFA